MFRSWTEGLHEHSDVSLTAREGRRVESVVKQRFIDIHD